MISWSHSALSQFETCPSQYAAERIYKLIPRSTNEASIWGNEVHEALEHRLRDGTPLSERFASYEEAALKVEKMQGHLFVEHEMALTRDYKPCAWEAPNMWVRGIIDALVVNNTQAWAGDWKTGAIRDDSLQLQLFALYVFAHFPNVILVHTAYEWLKFGKTTENTFYRSDIPVMWQPFEIKVAKLQEAADLDIWTPRPSGLCKHYCNNTLCEYHGVGNRRY
jgi:hypothetical protein